MGDFRSTFGEQAEDGRGPSISLGCAGLLMVERSEHVYDAAVHGEGFQPRWDAGVWEDVAASLADLAALAETTGRAEQAARLFGAAAAVREETGRPLVSHYPERDVFERAEARTRMALGAEGFVAAEARGRALPREEAIAEALALADEITGE